MSCLRMFAWVVMLVPGTCLSQEVHTAVPDKLSDQQFTRMTVDLLAAEVREDTAVISKALTATYSHTHATGRLQSRSEFMKDFAPGTHKYKGADLSEMVVRSYGTSALVSGREHINVDGPNGDHYYTFTAFWVQDRGEWRIAAWITSSEPKNQRVP